MKPLFVGIGLFVCIPAYGQTLTTSVSSELSHPSVNGRLTGAPRSFAVVPDPTQQRQDIGRCAIRLKDLKSGVSLRIRESHITTETSIKGDTTFTVVRGYGDYAVSPAGSYAVKADEFVRIDCAD